MSSLTSLGAHKGGSSRFSQLVHSSSRELATPSHSFKAKERRRGMETSAGLHSDEEEEGDISEDEEEL